MKLIKAFLVMVVITMFLGCETEAIRFDDPKKFEYKVQYFKDKNGNCFAVLGIRKTGSIAMSGIGLSFVPSENCE